MLTLNPRKRKDRPPRNKIAAILLSILWGISAIITGILDYKDIIDITDVVRLPIGYVILIFILLGSVAIYTLYSIYKLIKEIRDNARTKNIETAEEVFQRKYGDEFEIKKSPVLTKLVSIIEGLGAVRIVQTHSHLPKVEFYFPPDHKFDSLQPFLERYLVASNDEKFTKRILDETLIDEVVSEKEAHLEQISVHGNTLTATLSSIESVELFFILMSTIMNTYTR